MLFPELEELSPRRRMLRFLELSFQCRKSTPDELAMKLGYANVSMLCPTELVHRLC